MKIHGIELIDEGDMVVLAQKNNGQFEPLSMALWLEVSRPGKVVIDVGAYTGLYALAASKAGAEAWAIEPNPSALARLQQNARANGLTVRGVNAAAGEKDGDAPMYMRARLSSANSLIPQKRPTVRVRVMPIDGMHIGEVSAIKIDVEGYEPDVLRGAAETIRRWHPLLITEANTLSAAKAQEAVMAELGYGKPRPVDLRNLVWQ